MGNALSCTIEKLIGKKSVSCGTLSSTSGRPSGSSGNPFAPAPNNTPSLASGATSSSIVAKDFTIRDWTSDELAKFGAFADKSNQPASLTPGTTTTPGFYFSEYKKTTDGSAAKFYKVSRNSPKLMRVVALSVAIYSDFPDFSVAKFPSLHLREFQDTTNRGGKTMFVVREPPSAPASATDPFRGYSLKLADLSSTTGWKAINPAFSNDADLCWDDPLIKKFAQNALDKPPNFDANAYENLLIKRLCYCAGRSIYAKRNTKSLLFSIVGALGTSSTSQTSLPPGFFPPKDTIRINALPPDGEKRMPFVSSSSSSSSSSETGASFEYVYLLIMGYLVGQKVINIDDRWAPELLRYTLLGFTVNATEKAINAQYFLDGQISDIKSVKVPLLVINGKMVAFPAMDPSKLWPGCFSDPKAFPQSTPLILKLSYALNKIANERNGADSIILGINVVSPTVATVVYARSITGRMDSYAFGEGNISSFDVQADPVLQCFKSAPSNLLPPGCVDLTKDDFGVQNVKELLGYYFQGGFTHGLLPTGETVEPKIEDPTKPYTAINSFTFEPISSSSAQPNPGIIAGNFVVDLKRRYISTKADVKPSDPLGPVPYKVGVYAGNQCKLEDPMNYGLAVRQTTIDNDIFSKLKTAGDQPKIVTNCSADFKTPKSEIDAALAGSGCGGGDCLTPCMQLDASGKPIPGKSSPLGSVCINSGEMDSKNNPVGSGPFSTAYYCTWKRCEKETLAPMKVPCWKRATAWEDQNPNTRCAPGGSAVEANKFAFRGQKCKKYGQTWVFLKSQTWDDPGKWVLETDYKDGDPLEEISLPLNYGKRLNVKEEININIPYSDVDPSRSNIPNRWLEAVDRINYLADPGMFWEFVRVRSFQDHPVFQDGGRIPVELVNTVVPHSEYEAINNKLSAWWIKWKKLVNKKRGINKKFAEAVADLVLEYQTIINSAKTWPNAIKKPLVADGTDVISFVMMHTSPFVSWESIVAQMTPEQRKTGLVDTTQPQGSRALFLPYNSHPWERVATRPINKISANATSVTNLEVEAPAKFRFETFNTRAATDEDWAYMIYDEIMGGADADGSFLPTPGDQVNPAYNNFNTIYTNLVYPTQVDPNNSLYTWGDKNRPRKPKSTDKDWKQGSPGDVPAPGYVPALIEKIKTAIKDSGAKWKELDVMSTKGVWGLANIRLGEKEAEMNNEEIMKAKRRANVLHSSVADVACMNLCKDFSSETIEQTGLCDCDTGLANWDYKPDLTKTQPLVVPKITNYGQSGVSIKVVIPRGAPTVEKSPDTTTQVLNPDQSTYSTVVSPFIQASGYKHLPCPVIGAITSEPNNLLPFGVCGNVDPSDPLNLEIDPYLPNKSIVGNSGLPCPFGPCWFNDEAKFNAIKQKYGPTYPKTLWDYANQDPYYVKRSQTPTFAGFDLQAPADCKDQVSGGQVYGKCPIVGQQFPAPCKKSIDPAYQDITVDSYFLCDAGKASYAPGSGGRDDYMGGWVYVPPVITTKRTLPENIKEGYFCLPSEEGTTAVSAVNSQPLQCINSVWKTDLKECPIGGVYNNSAPCTQSCMDSVNFRITEPVYLGDSRWGTRPTAKKQSTLIQCTNGIRDAKYDREKVVALPDIHQFVNFSGCGPATQNAICPPGSSGLPFTVKAIPNNQMTTGCAPHYNPYCWSI